MGGNGKREIFVFVYFIYFRDCWFVDEFEVYFKDK